jgi:hypothetical protein
LEIARRVRGPDYVETLGASEQQNLVIYPFASKQPTKIVATPEIASFPIAQQQMRPGIEGDYMLGYMSGIGDSPADRATNFFILNHVMGNARSFRYLRSFYDSGDMDDHLSATIRAVGFASMSKTVRSSKLEQYARKEYVSALRLTNAALQSYDLATRDSTLSAVMLLDFFEKVIHPRQRTLAAWSGHLNGAAALMKLRGQKQFRTEIGLQLFTQMGADILLGCMQRGIPLPEDYVTLRASAVPFLDTTDAAWRLTEVTVRYIGFRTVLQDGSLTNPDAIILAVAELDKAMVSILDTLPPEWQYETIPVQSDLLYEPHIHVYNDYRITEAINMIRAGRVPLLELIQEQCRTGASSPSPSFMMLDYAKQLQLATDGIRKMASEICASVAQQAGYKTLLAIPPTKSTSMSTIQRKITRDACGASAYSLIWPLYVIGRSPSTEVSLRLWIIRQLRFVGASMGIEQAVEVAEYLEGGEDIDVWSVFSMLGNVAYFADQS